MAVKRIKKAARPSVENVKSSKIDLTKKAVTKLPAPGDPYVTPDGKVVQPEHLFAGEHHLSDQVKSSKDYRPSRKRAARELPATPQIMKGVLLVFGLTILGISEREIGEMLGITVSQVRTIRGHMAYAESFEIIATEFVNAKSKRLVSRIAAYADAALDQVADIAENGKESNRLKASIDILDRAGVRPKDTAEMGKTSQSELRITILKGDGTDNVVVDDVTID